VLDPADHHGVVPRRDQLPALADQPGGRLRDDREAVEQRDVAIEAGGRVPGEAFGDRALGRCGGGDGIREKGAMTRS
jgi:hypothetical protein